MGDLGIYPFVYNSCFLMILVQLFAPLTVFSLINLDFPFQQVSKNWSQTSTFNFKTKIFTGQCFLRFIFSILFAIIICRSGQLFFYVTASFRVFNHNRRGYSLYNMVHTYYAFPPYVDLKRREFSHPF